MMRTFTIACMYMAASVALMAGCGGMQTSSFVPNAGSPGNRATGSVTMSVIWPARSRLVPVASQSIQATITSGSSNVGSQVLVPPATGNTSSVTFSAVPVGNVTLTAIAYPNVNASGMALAEGSAPVQVTANQTTPVTVTMVSTISVLQLSPVNPTIIAGRSQQMTVTARDNSGSIVLLTPDKLNWSSTNTSFATVSTVGLVSALSGGNTTVTVVDTESRKSASVNVVVNGCSIPICPDGRREGNALDAEGVNNGTPSGGITYGPGQTGQGFVFNGVDGVINLGNPISLSLTASITIDAWVDVNSIPSASQSWSEILFRGDDRAGIDPYFLAIFSDGTLVWQIAASTTVTAQLSTPISLGVFHHITATLNDVNGDMRLYLDGNLAGELTTAVRPAAMLEAGIPGGVAIGNVSGAPQSEFHYPFNGTIDEVKVYNQVVLP